MPRKKLGNKCKTCGKPVGVVRDQCYHCRPALTPGRKSSPERFRRRTITSSHGIGRQFSVIESPIAGHPLTMDGRRQTFEYEARKNGDRARIPVACKGSADRERDAWAALARAERARTTEEHSRGKDRRRPGDGITGELGWDAGSFVHVALLATPDAE